MSQRFGVFEEVLQLNFTRQLFHLRHIFPLCLATYLYKACGNCPRISARKCQNTRPTHGRINYFQSYFHTRVRQDAVALVACDIVDAGPLVEAGVRGTLVNVGLAVWSCG